MTCSCRYTLHRFRAARRVLRSAHDDETETKEAPACRDTADRGFFFAVVQKVWHRFPPRGIWLQHCNLFDKMIPYKQVYCPCCIHTRCAAYKYIVPGLRRSRGTPPCHLLRKGIANVKQTTIRYKRKPKNKPGQRLILPGLALLVIVVFCLVLFLVTQSSEGEPAVPETGTSAGAWMKNDAGYYFNSAGEPILAATLKGIDVSKYQGEIDWQKAKDAGIDFAILRCGIGSEWNGEGEYTQDDDYWERNADACTELGIPFGVYLYSYATTEEQARSEAAHVARLLGLIESPYEELPDYTDKPYKLDYPVYYDLEDASITGLFPEEMAAITAAFFDQLEQYGYTGRQGIYASLNWVRARFDDPAFDPWREELWIARYSSELGYTGTYSMWQTTYQAPGADYGVQSETVDIDFVMEELTMTGITDTYGKVIEPSFTNDTYKSELSLGQKGDKATITLDEPEENDGGQKVYWSTSDPDVATVSKKGVVQAKGDGQCTVTATLADGRTWAECTVRVGDITVPIYATGSLNGTITDGDVSLADVSALKAGNEDAILIDAGGSLQGSLATSLTGGMDMTSAFAAAGYDLQCFDASDLAFGTERLLDDVVTASGESLASNLRDAEGVPLFYRSTSWNRNRITNGMNAVIKTVGKRIGFFSLASIGNSAKGSELSAADLAQTASEQVAALRAEDVDAIVCVVGPDTDYTAVLGNLADLGVNAVIAGGETEEVSAQGITVVPAGGGLSAVGCLELTFTASGTVTAKASQVTQSTMTAARSSFDETVAAAYDSARSGLDTLEQGDESVRSQTLFTHEQASRTISFGNYVAETYLNLAEADRDNWPAEYASMTPVGLAGGVSELDYGEITRGALLDALPGGERVQLVAATGATYLELLNSGTVTETYTESLLSKDVAEDATVLIVTDTATLRGLSDQSYTVLRDYGDAFWCIRMAINDATGAFTEAFTLPEAPRYGVGRGDVTG